MSKKEPAMAETDPQEPAMAETDPEKPLGLWEGLLKTHQSSLKALFSPKKTDSDADTNPLAIPHLSPLANSVVSRCSTILQIPTEELERSFGTPIPEDAAELLANARHFLEFCSFKALDVLTRRTEYLSSKEFRHLTFDMMLAWEAPIPKTKPVEKEVEAGTSREGDDEGGWSMFYSNSKSMAAQGDDEKTVGSEAFERIAPSCVAVADIITVHNLFNALTSSTSHRLHFLVYDKYIRSLDKIIKSAKNASVTSIGNLQLAEDEIILDVDGSVPLQPILKHIGLSAWPGRLTLTNYGLYFESLGMGLYDKAVKYDLATDLKQVIKPELTGPLGARVFDKAVMYKSISTADPVFLEFTELKGNSRRDYWLDISLEILYVHRFIRKNNLKKIQKSEVLGRAILGIFRYRAVRDAFQFFPSQYKSLLPFNLAESLPGGDLILETLISRLALLNADVTQTNASGSPNAKLQPKLSPISLLTLRQFGFVLLKEVNLDEEENWVGDVCFGDTSPLKMAVKQSMSDTFSAEAAQASVDQVKVEGIDTNVAVMKELLFPVLEILSRLQYMASWEDQYKSAIFLMLTCWFIIRNWIRFVLPSIFLFTAVVMLWRRHFKKPMPLEPFKIKAPPSRNAVEQLLTLQDAISQMESLIQAGNIVLLKIRSLLYAALPQATDRIVLLLVFLAGAFAFVPFRFIAMLVFVEAFTREMPYRKESSNKVERRIREWWFRIPAAPVELVKPDDKKKKKA